MKTVELSDFVANPGPLLDDLAGGESIALMEGGAERARLEPPRPKPDWTPGKAKGSAVILGDIVAPPPIEGDGDLAS